MKKLRNWVRDYFAFSNTEMRGVLVLTIGIVLLLLLPRLYASFFRSEYTYLEKDQQVLDSLVMAFETVSEKERETKPDTAAVLLFQFNPNNADQASLELLGIPAYISARIIKYREKGGVFRYKKDLLKIYDFPQEVYKEIYHVIDLPEARTVRTQPKPQSKLRAFDLNLADTLQLSQLAGIGSVLSGRIVKFRNALGGFYATSQVKEVYNINETALEQIRKYTFIAENFVPNQLNVNIADIRELNRHPYISYELAKAILNHRKTYGNFTSLKDLKEVYLVDEKLLGKLLPYLTL